MVIQIVQVKILIHLVAIGEVGIVRILRDHTHFHTLNNLVTKVQVILIHLVELQFTELDYMVRYSRDMVKSSVMVIVRILVEQTLLMDTTPLLDLVLVVLMMVSRVHVLVAVLLMV